MIPASLPASRQGVTIGGQGGRPRRALALSPSETRNEVRREGARDGVRHASRQRSTSVPLRADAPAFVPMTARERRASTRAFPSASHQSVSTARSVDELLTALSDASPLPLRPFTVFATSMPTAGIDADVGPAAGAAHAGAADVGAVRGAVGAVGAAGAAGAAAVPRRVTFQQGGTERRPGQSSVARQERASERHERARQRLSRPGRQHQLLRSEALAVAMGRVIAGGDAGGDVGEPPDFDGLTGVQELRAAFLQAGDGRSARGRWPQAFARAEVLRPQIMQELALGLTTASVSAPASASSSTAPAATAAVTAPDPPAAAAATASAAAAAAVTAAVAVVGIGVVGENLMIDQIQKSLYSRSGMCVVTS